MHIAELNIGRTRFDLDDPRMAGFVDNLDRINAVAERAPGFVWRLTGEGNDATDLTLPGEPNAILNLSVWESAEALEAYVFNTVHVQFYRRKTEWFDHYEQAYFVMWPIPVGHRPSLHEAVSRLEDLRTNGPSERAYGWDALPHLKDWIAKRCA